MGASSSKTASVNNTTAKNTAIKQRQPSKEELALLKQAAMQSAQKQTNKSQAFDEYLKAANLGHRDAITPLERLAAELPAAKQLELSHVYGKLFKNHEKETYWRNQAKEVEGFRFKK